MMRTIFRREDIRNAILAIQSTNDSITNEIPIDEIRIYNAGFEAAISAIAKAFDVDIHEVRR